MILFTDPERIALLAGVVFSFVYTGKRLIPLLNGWGGLAANLVISAGMTMLVFGFHLTWMWFAAYLLVVLSAAGIHGTATKIMDYPSPHENPTPSGTPAQNYRAKVERNTLGL